MSEINAKNGWFKFQQTKVPDEREARMKENQETMRYIEEKWREPKTQVGNLVAKERQKVPVTHKSGGHKPVAGSSRNSQLFPNQVAPKRDKGQRGRDTHHLTKLRSRKIN
ncbi:hypothetical protein O181_036958 [Austropuccinia psidii MF-1]|uniref:Uncharacterized protein n=1 Tax=Austropuccinia psidii MF-1 TaxID=1389203 RepID=A0A9Q3H9N5_9BASI|nr:hypothetical protein [Austropuccinia psidii MF-1]